MSYRRPPSDVGRMTSLRVGNLPFRACIEVGPLFHFLFILNCVEVTGSILKIVLTSTNRPEIRLISICCFRIFSALLSQFFEHSAYTGNGNLGKCIVAEPVACWTANLLKVYTEFNYIYLTF
jgi:hypothetical protein